MYIEHPVITSEQGQESLASIEKILCQCVFDAGDTFNKICQAVPEVAIAFDGRARCSAVYALIAENVRTRIPALKISNISVVEIRGFVEVVIYTDEVILRLRFKKVNNRLRSRNYPTKQQQRIEHQLLLFDEPQSTVRLTIGHQFDPTGTRIDSVHVIYPYRKNPLWSYPLTASIFDNSIIPDAISASSIRVAKVRSKIAKNEEEVANGTTAD